MALRPCKTLSKCMRISKPDNTSCDLLESIQEAPKEIKSMVKELNLLHSILEDVKATEEMSGPHPTTTLALEGCAESLAEMNSILELLVPGFSLSSKFKRKRAAIQAVRQSKRFSRCKAKLQEAMLILNATQQTSAAYDINVS